MVYKRCGVDHWHFRTIEFISSTTCTLILSLLLLLLPEFAGLYRPSVRWPNDAGLGIMTAGSWVDVASTNAVYLVLLAVAIKLSRNVWVISKSWTFYVEEGVTLTRNHTCNKKKEYRIHNVPHIKNIGNGDLDSGTNQTCDCESSVHFPTTTTIPIFPILPAILRNSDPAFCIGSKMVSTLCRYFAVYDPFTC